MAIIFQLRWGKEHKPEPRRLLQRPTWDYSPAELGCLWRFGSVGPMKSRHHSDLARRGFLAIEAVTREERCRRTIGAKTVTDYVLKLVRRDSLPATGTHEESSPSRASASSVPGGLSAADRDGRESHECHESCSWTCSKSFRSRTPFLSINSGICQSTSTQVQSFQPSSEVWSRAPRCGRL